MSGPWEDYQNSDTDNGNGPWNDYAASPTSEKPKNTSFMGKLNAAINKAGAQTGKLTGLGNPLNPIAGAEEGAISFPIKAAQTGSQAISSILPKGAQNKLSGFNNTNIDQWLLQHGIGTSDNSLPTQLAQGSAAFAIPGSQEAKIASLIESASKLAPQGSSLLARLISGGESGLVNTNNPNDKLSNALGQGELNAVAPVALDKGVDALKALGRLFKPSRVLRGTLSPEELAKNAEAAKGTPTALGDVVDSEGLKKTYENIISKLPFSGASGKMSSVIENVSAKGKTLLNKILGSTDLDAVNKNISTAGEAALKKVLNVDDISDTSGQLTNDAENSLKQILGRDDLSDTNGQLADDGEQMLKNMFGADLNPEGAAKDLVENINKNYKEQDIAKGPLYKKRNQIAEANPKFKMKSTLFAEEAKKYSAAIKATKLLKLEPDQAKLFNKFENYKTANSGTPDKKSFIDDGGVIHFEDNPEKGSSPLSLGEAQVLKGHLNELASKAASSSDAAQRGASKIFKSLAAKLSKDMENSIKASGDQELESAHKAANENYIKNYLPFLNKNIFKIVNGKIDPDTVVNHLIKTGPDSDRSTLLSSGTKLPGNIRAPLAKAYFSRAFKNSKLIPGKLSKLVNELGPNQLRELIPSPEERQNLKDYATYEKLQKKTGKALHQNGIVDPHQVAKLADEFDKNPSERKELIPDENRYSALQKYGQKYKTAKVFDSALNQDGSINADKLANTIEGLEKNPKKFNEIVPNKQTQERLKNFSKMMERINHFKSASEAGAANTAKLASLAKLLAESNEKSNRLLSKDNQKELSSFRTLQHMNKNVASVKANQPTGKTALDALIKVGIPALLGMHFGGLTGAAAAGVVASGSGRALTHLLTSEKVRDSLVKAMLNQKPITKGASKSTKALGQVLANAIAQGNANG